MWGEVESIILKPKSVWDTLWRAVLETVGNWITKEEERVEGPIKEVEGHLIQIRLSVS